MSGEVYISVCRLNNRDEKPVVYFWAAWIGSFPKDKDWRSADYWDAFIPEHPVAQVTKVLRYQSGESILSEYRQRNIYLGLIRTSLICKCTEEHWSVLHARNDGDPLYSNNVYVPDKWARMQLRVLNGKPARQARAPKQASRSDSGGRGQRQDPFNHWEEYVRSQQASSARQERVSRPARPKPAPPPSCFVALGLTLPCTEDEVRRAFRKLCLTAHPDHGGSSKAFIALTEARDEALRYLIAVA